MECGETYPWCPPLRVGECSLRARIRASLMCANAIILRRCTCSRLLIARLVLISVLTRTVLNLVWSAVKRSLGVLSCSAPLRACIRALITWVRAISLLWSSWLFIWLTAAHVCSKSFIYYYQYSLSIYFNIHCKRGYWNFRDISMPAETGILCEWVMKSWLFNEVQ